MLGMTVDVFWESGSINGIYQCCHLIFLSEVHSSDDRKAYMT